MYMEEASHTVGVHSFQSSTHHGSNNTVTMLALSFRWNCGRTHGDDLAVRIALKVQSRERLQYY